MVSLRQHYVDSANTEMDDRPVDTLIDAHTHIGQVRQYDLPVTPERMIEYMDTYDVDKAVVHPLESPEATSYLIPTRDVLTVANRYPDRLIPFCSIDPRAPPL